MQNKQPLENQFNLNNDSSFLKFRGLDTFMAPKMTITVEKCIIQ